MSKLPLLLLFALLIITGPAQAQDKAAQAIFDTFLRDYRNLKVPEFEMSYVANFKNIPQSAELARQYQFFRNYQASLETIARAALSPEMRYRYDELKYAIDFQLELLDLEKQLKPMADIPPTGLSALPNGHQWYRLYIKRWGSKALTPDQLLALGESEVARVSSEIRALQRQLGYAGQDEEFYRHLHGPEFDNTDESQVKSELLELRERIRQHLSQDFEDVNFTPVDIQNWPDANKDTPPGYYDLGVFHYTFFNGHFPARAKEWLFIHEADPGHHYQTVIAKNRPPLRELFWYPGFSEGWGAYAEDLGKDFGCYGDPYQYLGKWEWDLVRSARVVLDVRIHDQGWTRQQALTWFRQHVPGQDEIAEREVDRVIRWPAQVISYKVGEAEILSLRAEARLRLGARFNLRRFHSLVLQRGSVPLPILAEIVHDWIESSE